MKIRRKRQGGVQVLGSTLAGGFRIGQPLDL